MSCRALTFVYPFGATLSVMKPAVAVLSTGSVCFPLNRPILAFYHSKVRPDLDRGGCVVFVVGQRSLLCRFWRDYMCFLTALHNSAAKQYFSYLHFMYGDNRWSQA